MKTDTPSTIDTFMQRLRVFNAERDWAQFHDPKNLVMTVASEAGELLAEFRWVRNEASDEHASGEARPRIADEAADVGIALLLFCDRIGLDLLEAMYRKLEKNRQKYPAEASRSRPDPPGESKVS
jgi:NTP pyrophosphatase (non-canonical NTP hydrolase)